MNEIVDYLQHMQLIIFDTEIDLDMMLMNATWEFELLTINIFYFFLGSVLLFFISGLGVFSVVQSTVGHVVKLVGLMVLLVWPRMFSANYFNTGIFNRGLTYFYEHRVLELLHLPAQALDFRHWMNNVFELSLTSQFRATHKLTNNSLRLYDAWQEDKNSYEKLLLPRNGERSFSHEAHEHFSWRITDRSF